MYRYGLTPIHTPLSPHRLNKYNKSLVQNPHHCEINLAKATRRDVAAHFANLNADETPESRSHPHPRQPNQCVVWGTGKLYFPSELELADLRLQGADVQMLSVTSFEIAYILNNHFKAGEWGSYPRCGSVITCVIGGRSLYGYVKRFLKVEGDDCPGYASVGWFSEPVYIFGAEYPLGVCVNENGGDVEREVGTCILRLTQIDPSRVMVERDLPNGRFFMMRDSGYDTVRLAVR